MNPKDQQVSICCHNWDWWVLTELFSHECKLLSFSSSQTFWSTQTFHMFTQPLKSLWKQNRGAGPVLTQLVAKFLFAWWRENESLIMSKWNIVICCNLILQITTQIERLKGELEGIIESNKLKRKIQTLYMILTGCVLVKRTGFDLNI